tara:strand:+ start:653 stop:856 length:204 start_codon:yes stop_codon:yes gene_type:complete
MDIEYKEKTDVYVETIRLSKIHKISDTHAHIFRDRNDIEKLCECHDTTLMLERVDGDTERAKEADCF